FASTSTVYGDAEQIPTPEDYTPLKPISVYGAVKLSCETLISTYSRLYGLKSLILRYANVVGPRSKHGVLVDFVNKLKSNLNRLEILGDGLQRKSYIYVEEAVDASLKALEHMLENDSSEEVFNVGSEDWVYVKEIADMVVKAMGLSGVEYVYKPATDDGRGWLGDVKLMLLDVDKLKKATGWRLKMGSREALRKTLESLLQEVGSIQS
ncbi:MAG: NAD-dependent epimerase/dehydratase family protein, partial [Candidatus Brockarchaeota archaeon]|nr:NAD-dependent epimerase/dehydratase family protein [Candidatus Brockarchaeota archaeon]